MALTLADANRIIGASITAADEIGIKLSVAVVDGAGNRWPSSGWKGPSR